MRYFLFTTYVQKTVEVTHRYNFTYESPTFPSIMDLTGGSDNVIIQYIFEFKSKEDYESFTSKA